MYTVIGSVKTRTLRVLWLLEELGVEYAFQPALPRSPEVLALSPLGKVPVLLDGDHVFTDSTAIMTYLADKHGQLTYAAGTPGRAVQDGHTNFLLDEFDACLWSAARHSFVLPKERRMPDIKDTLKWEFERSLKHLATRLGDRAFLMGETMTIPDIIAAHCGNWAKSAKFPISDPAVCDYMDRLRARPAYARAVNH